MTRHMSLGPGKQLNQRVDNSTWLLGGVGGGGGAGGGGGEGEGGGGGGGGCDSPEVNRFDIFKLTFTFLRMAPGAPAAPRPAYPRPM